VALDPNAPSPAIPLETLAVDQVAAFWQLPLTLFAGWCEFMAVAGPGTHHTPHPHLDAHEQLVVPEPIEEAGEHALFA
jgi:hypothetical protein